MTTNTELTTEVNDLPQLPAAYSTERLADPSRMVKLLVSRYHAAKAETQRIAGDELAKAQAKEREHIALEKAVNYAVEQLRLLSRASDKAHRTKINREALMDLMWKAEINENAAKRVITAIAKGEVANMKVIY